jgi:hypothetical protein
MYKIERRDPSKNSLKILSDAKKNLSKRFSHYGRKDEVYRKPHCYILRSEIPPATLAVSATMVVQ